MSTTAAPSAAQDQPQNLKVIFPPTSPPQHRRGYQACDPCRKRKVKCDLGSVDNPRPPPCVRCRRESKRCEFSATRRKRKASEDPDDVAQTPNSPLRRDKRMMVADGTYADAVNNGTPSFQRGESSSLKSENGSSYPPWSEMSPGVGRGSHSDTSQPRPDTSLSPTQFQGYRPVPNTTTATPATAAYSGLGRGGGSAFALEGGQHMMNKTAAELLSPAISNSHDALHLLSEAAGRTEDLNRQSLENRYAANQSAASTFASQGTHLGQAQAASNRTTSNARVQKPGSIRSHLEGTALGAVTPSHDPHADPSAGLEDPAYLSAMRAWSRLRFVRAGWFTIDEAMAYIAYYYKHLAPLTPIVLPNYSLISSHLSLLTDEPVLTVTLLTIASRHMELTGNGAKSRAFSIHERLWSYLRGMIERLFWGQEKFGSGVSGINLAKYREVCPPTGKAHLKGHLRSLGTVEALLLLTDWHPRALHFPPGDDENTLLDMDADILNDINRGEEGDDHNQSKGQGGNSDSPLALYKWLEPAWRSDRMSWMLLSTTQALAFELGVFDQKNDGTNVNETGVSLAEQTRKRRVRRLILVYITQSSGRLGISSMLPLPQWTKDTEPMVLENNPGIDLHDDASVDAMHDCWMEISKIMYKSNQQLFLSKEQTSELIRTGRYRDKIDQFTPALREFRQKFDRLPLSAPMRNILTIEYEYTRLYVNCLALQAVVDRWTTMTNDASTSNTGRPNSSGSGPTSATSGPAPFRVLMEQYRVNEPYIQEVVDASRKILQTVLEGLVPGDCLKHAPVRTYFRILSGMIFILKTFTLGAKEDDVRVSLELQDRTIECLRTCVVDDVHLSVTISDLLQLLTANIRTRFLRFAPLDRTGDTDGREQSPLPNATNHQSPYPQDNMESRRGSTNNQWQQNPLNDGFQVDNNNSSNNISTTPVAGYNDPLANIPAQPINSSNLNVSFMPPPASFYHNYYDTNGTPPTMDINDPTLAPQAIQETNGSGPSGSSNATGIPDWFALPLDQFFNSSTAGVDQGLGGTGPMVGELDMLEVLLNEQYDRDGTGGGSGQTSHFL